MRKRFLRHFGLMMLWAGVCMFASVEVLAQHNPFGQIPVTSLGDPYLVLIRDPVVHKEMKINAEQGRAILALTDELDGQIWTLRNQSGPEATDLFQKLNATAKSRMQQILTGPQYTRLERIRIAIYGLYAFNRDEVAERIKLTEDQREKIKVILEEDFQEKVEAAKEKEEGKSGKPKPKKTSTQARITAVLTKEQVVEAYEMFGPPVDASKMGFVKFKAPDFLSEGGWINSPPLTMSQLKGKVVALHFWTFG